MEEKYEHVIEVAAMKLGYLGLRKKTQKKLSCFFIRNLYHFLPAVESHCATGFYHSHLTTSQKLTHFIYFIFLPLIVLTVVSHVSKTDCVILIIVREN